MTELTYPELAVATWALCQRIREGRTKESDIAALVSIERHVESDKLRRMASDALITACIQGHEDLVFKYHDEEGEECESGTF